MLMCPLFLLLRLVLVSHMTCLQDSGPLNAVQYYVCYTRKVTKSCLTILWKSKSKSLWFLLASPTQALNSPKTLALSNEQQPTHHILWRQKSILTLRKLRPDTQLYQILNIPNKAWQNVFRYIHFLMWEGTLCSSRKGWAWLLIPFFLSILKS